MQLKILLMYVSDIYQPNFLDERGIFYEKYKQRKVKEIQGVFFLTGTPLKSMEKLRLEARRCLKGLFTKKISIVISYFE